MAVALFLFFTDCLSLACNSPLPLHWMVRYFSHSSRVDIGFLEQGNQQKHCRMNFRLWLIAKANGVYLMAFAKSC
jgi:hypothetical protein